jgi:hypothetical protein
VRKLYRSAALVDVSIVTGAGLGATSELATSARWLRPFVSVARVARRSGTANAPPQESGYRLGAVTVVTCALVGRIGPHSAKLLRHRAKGFMVVTGVMEVSLHVGIPGTTALADGPRPTQTFVCHRTA